VESINTQSEELTFISTQIKAYQAYMKAKKLTVKAAYNKNSSKFKSWGREFELNLDTLNSGISISLNQERYHEETPFTVHISVTERLDLEINGHADIKGARIEAGELHAAFDSLVLESIYSLLKQKGWGTNLGFDGDDINGEFDIEVKKGNRHVIDELTTLIGIKQQLRS
jgi:hypothetical protein